MPRTPALLHGVLCDTSYLIRWAKPSETLHPAAQAYLKFLVEGGHTLYVSTIALAEYAVRDAIANLPMRYFRVVPFNVDHAQRAGEFARAVFEARGALPQLITHAQSSRTTPKCSPRLTSRLRSPTTSPQTANA